MKLKLIFVLAERCHYQNALHGPWGLRPFDFNFIHYFFSKMNPTP